MIETGCVYNLEFSQKGNPNNCTFMVRAIVDESHIVVCNVAPQNPEMLIGRYRIIDAGLAESYVQDGYLTKHPTAPEFRSGTKANCILPYRGCLYRRKNGECLDLSTCPGNSDASCHKIPQRKWQVRLARSLDLTPGTD